MSKRLRADLLLLCVALIWGTAFVVQRIASQQISQFALNGFRFLIGGVVLVPLATRGWKPGEILGKDKWQHFLGSVGWVLLAGSILFLAAALQQMGLKTTAAGNAGFFTSLYVVIVPFLLHIFWRQKIRLISWAAAILAAIGAALLSTGGVRIQPAPGDGLELGGAFVWALHLIVVGLAVKNVNVFRFSVGQYLVAGMLNLGMGYWVDGDLLRGVNEAWWMVLYLGLFSTALGYTLQAIGQQSAPPADAAMLLSLEAVFAALSGWLFIAERLNLIQLIGCGMIFAGVILSQLWPKNLSKPEIP